MVCPECRAGCAAEDLYCRRCGSDLSLPSKSLVLAQTQALAPVMNSPLPRVAAGVGAVAVGIGLELLRRGLLARLTRSSRRAQKLPAFPTSQLLDHFAGKEQKKSARLPRGHEVHETMIYVSRVMRRDG